MGLIHLTLTGSLRLSGTNAPLAAHRIELWDTAVYGRIASTLSDANGNFEFQLPDPVAAAITGGEVTLHYRVYKDDIFLLDASAPSDYHETVSLYITPVSYDTKVTDETADSSVKFFTVSGVFTDSKGIVVSAAKIFIYESGLREKLLLASVSTDVNGRYKARISAKDVSRTTVPVNRSIRVEAVDAEDNILAASPDIFDQGTDMQVDIAAEGNYKTTSEFDGLKAAMLSIDESLNLTSLSADADGVDEIRYVAGAIDRHATQVELIVQAHKYGAAVAQPADYLYALCRKSGTDRNPLLGMKKADIQAAITEAIDQNVIAARSSGDIDGFLAAVDKFQIAATRVIKVKGEDNVTINDLLTHIFSSEEDIMNFLRKYNEDDYESTAAFWTAYTTAHGAEKAADAQRGLKLITITGSQPEMIGKLMNMGRPSSPTDPTTAPTPFDNSFHYIATLTTSQWNTLIDEACTASGKLCVPAAIRSAHPEASNTELKQIYAEKLKSVSQDFFPLVALHGMIDNYEGTPLISNLSDQGMTKNFIANNPSFDLRSESIHDINATDYDLTGIADVEKLRANLAPFQRLLRVTGGKPEAVAAMKVAGLDSADAITQVSQEDFVAAYANKMGGSAAAVMAYAKATAVAAVTTNALTDATQKLTDPGLAVLPAFALNDLTDPKAYPDLSTLFGSMDYCSCQECLSLYSPAAYMTDMLNFLRTKVPAAYNELVRRRPDLKYIDLTCKNTNTTLPYIDLVNELLELYVLSVNSVSGMPASFQTNGTSKDLSAYPEHIFKNGSGVYTDYFDYSEVYDTYLSAAVYPYENPFKLAIEETRTYLQHLGLPRLEAMKLYRPVNQPAVSVTTPAPFDAITDYSIYAEYLGISLEALNIITDAGSTTPWEYYGFTGSSVSGMIDPSNSAALLPTSDWKALLTGRIDVLMQQTKISYTELLEYLDTDFLNKVNGTNDPDISILPTIGSPNDTCTTSKLRLNIASPSTAAGFLDKLHRMIRLVRTGKLSIYQWDTLFRILGITNLDTDDMLLLGRVLMMADQLKIKPELLACWWHDIDTHQYTNYKSENLVKLDAVYDAVFRNKQVISSSAQAFPAAAQVGTLGTYAANAATIAALCRMRENELQMMLDLLQVPAGDTISLTVLSRLYILSQLAKSFGYSISDMRHVFVLAGVTPSPTNPSGAAAIATAVGKLADVQSVAGMIKNSGFRLDELNYLLRNYDPLDRLAPDVKKIQIFYEGLRKELQKFPVFAAVNTSAMTATEQEAFHKLLNVIIQQFSKEFNCPSEWIKAIFTEQYAAPASYFVEAAFVTSAYDLSYQNCLHPSTLGVTLPSFDLIELYDWYRKLHKITMIASKLKIKTAELTYFLDPANTAIGFSFYNLPYMVDGDGELVENTVTLAFTKKLFTLAAWIAVRSKLSLNEDELVRMIDAAVAHDKPVLSALVGRDIENKEAVDILIGSAATTPSGLLSMYNSADYDPSVYENVMRYLTIIHIVAFCDRTGLKADTLHSVICPDVTMEDSRKVLLAAKGKYSDEEWVKIAKPLRNELRRKQRAALVAYVLAHPNPSAHMRWLNENDLFAYLLIDVEMDSCMATSRIKQGISSIQLFIDRVLMGLESTTSGGPISMAASYAQQWETWRKWYRIWEANRKIFLYPENWIEPELRDDKSVFFEELETALQQDDLTPERAQDAIYDYLLKLDETARMEPVGVVDEEVETVNNGITTKKTVSHVFARTYSDPQHYYYRRLKDDEWTPWERVDIDIKSEHIAPVIWNNRVYLFWLTFREKQFKGNGIPLSHASDANKDNWNWFYNDLTADQQQPGDSSDDKKVVQKQLEVSLNWTEYKNGKWLKHKISKDKVSLNLYPGVELNLFSWAGKQFNGLANSAKEYYNFLSNKKEMSIVDLAKSRFYLRPYIRDTNKHLHLMLMFPYKLWDMSTERTFYIHGFEFADSSIDPQVWRYPDANASGILKWNIPAPGGTAFSNMRFIKNLPQKATKLNVDTYSVVPNGGMYIYRDETIDTSVSPRVRSSSAAILNKTYDDVYKVLVKSDFVNNPMEDKFFFEDNKNTFFVRKMISDKHLTNPVVKSNEVNLSIAGYASSGIYQDAGQTPSHIDVTGMTVSAYSDNTNIVPAPAVPAYYFQTFYNPHTRHFIETFNREGVEKMLQIGMQTQADTMAFQSSYLPTALVHPDYPKDKVDFDYWGAYSGYNWELFFHVPMMIAQRLSDNQQFEEARKWYHYIFDPTSDKNAAGNQSGSVQRFWKFRPFYDAAGQPVQTLNDLMILISYGNAAAVSQVKKWEDNPFKPHVIARMRIVAYMKNVVMKYIDNLIAWGDQLFRRDTIESINEATQLYMLAANILGKKPTEVRRRSQSAPKSFQELSGTLDAFSNARVYIESFIDNSAAVSPIGSAQLHPPQMFYFCLSRNEKLMGYWDTVADRLFKIRNCMNIDGQVRQLPLFEPPIDPALLVRAAAAGLDINSVLNDLTSAPSHYRFNYVLQKASEFCADVKSLGGALLSALEKKDAEHLSLLRSGQEISLLEKIKLVKQSQIDEANANLEALQQTREITQARYEYYSSREFMNDKEKDAMKNVQTGMVLQTVQGEMSVLAAALSVIPKVHVQGLASGTSFGGTNWGIALGAISNQLGVLANISSAKGSLASTMAGYERRMDDWQFQATTAQQELVQIDKQIVAAEIRLAIAEKELDNHELQIDNARETDDYMRSKFTNEQLYSWMSAQLSATYFQAYQLAYDMAKRAERCYQYELPLSEKSVNGFIKFGYWDSLKKGLLAGEKLHYDLHKMEVAYMEDNMREKELTKHVSLVLTDPARILELRETGTCTFSLPEALFDLDYPGHYLRRLKSVSISIPCVSGPYTTINATLSLDSSKYRKLATGATYAEDSAGPDTRFVYLDSPTNAIATSNAQNDAGLFELNFRDERYLPFEGRGAVSNWTLTLAGTDQIRLFDFNTINDVIIHLRYTAREDAALKTAAISHINALLDATSANPDHMELPRYFSLKHEFANDWYTYANKVAAGVTGWEMMFRINAGMFPAFTRNKNLPVSSLFFKLRGKAVLTANYRLYVTYQDNGVDTTVYVALNSSNGYENSKDLDFTVAGNAKILKLKLKEVISSSVEQTVNMDALLEDIFMVAYYSLDEYMPEADDADHTTIEDQGLVNSMLGWWRADTGIVKAGGLVDGWLDQSGRNNTLNAVSAATRPDVINNWRNGMPALRFNGAQALRKAMLTIPVNTYDVTVFMVGEKTNQTSNEEIFALSDSFGTSSAFGFFTNVNNMDIAAIYAGQGNSYHGAANTIMTNVDGLYLFRFNISDANPETSIEFNGTLYDDDFAPYTNTDNVGPAFPSNSFNVGSSTGTNYFAHFNIAELIIIPAKATAAQITTIKTYLKAKYDL